MSEPKPTVEEIRDTLGKLASCFSIPASPKIHRVNVVRPVEEVETIYLEALDVLRRSHE
jgi:hypothetical protein